MKRNLCLVVKRIMIPLSVCILSQKNISLITENIYINNPKSAYISDNVSTLFCILFGLNKKKQKTKFNTTQELVLMIKEKIR